MTKFHYSRILKPEKLTHHTTIEVIWTIIPTLIVLLIAIPSLTLIYSLDQHTERPGEDRDGVRTFSVPFGIHGSQLAGCKQRAEVPTCVVRPLLHSA